MKKCLLLGVVSLFCLNAQAQSNLEEVKTYMSAKAKYSLLDSDVSAGGYDVTTVDEDVAGFGVAVGIAYKDPSGMLRTELEYNKNGNSTKSYGVIDFEVETQSVMLNTYYHLPTGSALTPYIGGGIGVSHIKGTAELMGLSGSIKKTNFAWQAGAGISYDLTKNFALDLGYRYMDYGDFEKDGVSLDTTAHEFYTGIRISF